MAAKVIERLTDGSLPANTMPGCYPLLYHVADGGILCADCANGKNGSLASTDEGTPDDWHIVGQDVYWEGGELCCDHCNGPIQSAYGAVDKSGGSSHCAADNYLNS